ncbi:MAG: hypothetical protein MHPSP_003369, partial [Paramarteilia canceri]
GGDSNKNKRISDDVKYHYGCANDEIKLENGKIIHGILMYNPSHLESVNGVVYGYTHAIQNLSKFDKKDTIGILIHGDASFNGQGVVYESLQFNRLENYSANGIIHVIVNNNIGFTTESIDYSSSPNSSTIGSTFDLPALRVNGNCIESIICAAKLASIYRNAFNKDILVEINGNNWYRKFGHNEMDEPSMTQPEAYTLINSNSEPTPVNSLKNSQNFLKYKDDLNIESMIENNYKKLENSLSKIDKASSKEVFKMSTFAQHQLNGNKNNLLTQKTIEDIFGSFLKSIKKVEAHRSVARTFATKNKLLETNGKLDWSSAELLAIASLLKDGISVRIAGQDVQRGTFTQKHHYIHNQKPPYEKISIFDSIMSMNGS